MVIIVSMRHVFVSGWWTIEGSEYTVCMDIMMLPNNYRITGIVVCMFAHVYMFQVSNHSALCWLDYFLGLIHHRSVSGAIGNRTI